LLIFFENGAAAARLRKKMKKGGWRKSVQGLRGIKKSKDSARW